MNRYRTLVIGIAIGFAFGVVFLWEAMGGHAANDARARHDHGGHAMIHYQPLELDEGVIHPQFAQVAETYELLTVAKAQTTLRYWNWSLSSAFSPTQTHLQEHLQEPANEEAAFSAAQRTARLVFGR